jgi:endonuclease YncB( thermonuclease family)
MYEYQVKVTRVIDGDTCRADIDLGFAVHVNQTLRLSGINAPEPHTETSAAGNAATNHLIQLIDDAQEQGPMFVRTEQDKRGSFGRYLAVLFSHHGQNINDQMIADGHAVPY